MSSSEKLSKAIVPALKELTEASVYSNSLVVKHYGNLTMRKALQSKTKSVGLYQKEDEVTIRMCITNLFIGTSRYFNNELKLDKAEVIAEEILANYNYRQLRLEDLFVICKEIKESDLIILTPARILKHIAKYCQNREAMAIRLSQELSEKVKGELGDSNIDDRIKGSIRHLERSNEIVVKQRLNAKKYR